jgi:hypothetical protein
MWVGQPITLTCRRGPDRIDKDTGEVLVTWQKMVLSTEADPVIADPPFVTEPTAADVSDPIGAHDDEALDEADVRPFPRRQALGVRRSKAHELLHRGELSSIRIVSVRVPVDTVRVWTTRQVAEPIEGGLNPLF